MITKALPGKHTFTTRCMMCWRLFSSLPAYKGSRQRGYGKIVALSSYKVGGSSINTNLTELTHSSPMRLVPSRRSHPAHSKSGTGYEAAIVHLSSYGGGYVPGDIIDLDVNIRGEGAVVYILTQGGTRIYRPGDNFRQYADYKHQEEDGLSKPPKDSFMAKLCESTINCNVDPGATLLFLPDPTVPYFQTSFEEKRMFNCKHINGVSGSIIAVDWYASGRRHSTDMEEERWAFDYLATRTELYSSNQQTQDPAEIILIESMVLDNTTSAGKHTSISSSTISMGKNYDSYATLLLHGPNSHEVAKKANLLARYLASTKTRVRQENCNESNNLEDDESNVLQLSTALGGRVLMSISPMENQNNTSNQGSPLQQTYMVRILAESNEDVYRVLHFCLKPCSRLLGGLEPYKDRIHSSGTVRSESSILSSKPRKPLINTRLRNTMYETGLEAIAQDLVFGKDNRSVNGGGQRDAWFYSCLFSDSALPVGGFAHSLSIEAASQVGLFSSADAHHDKGTYSCSETDLADYIYAVSRSSARFSTPIILGAYSLIAQPVSSLDVAKTHAAWIEIDEYTERLLKSNQPGCRASMDQGLGFLRIAPSLIERGNNDVSKLWEHIRASINGKTIRQSQDQSSKCLTSLITAKGHAAPMYGMLAGSLGIPPLDACRVFAFSAARDSISAAVRLNLLGPVAGLALLNNTGRNAVEEGLEEGLLSMSARTDPNDPIAVRYKSWLRSASTCAPIVDVVHPCHDFLAVRLFRT